MTLDKTTIEMRNELTKVCVSQIWQIRETKQLTSHYCEQLLFLQLVIAREPRKTDDNHIGTQQ